MGIRMRSILVMGILGFLAIGILGFTSYRLSLQNALAEAEIKSDLVMNYAMASREFTRVAQQPLVRQLVEEDRFYPEIMSGFATARGIYEQFEQLYPGYIFRQATIDPIHPVNKADEQELEIIRRFDEDRDLQNQRGTLVRDGVEMYYTATPFSVMSQRCLVCHGDPADAPKDQIEIYGADSGGYWWEMDEMVAAFIVYVPVEEAIAAARNMSLTLVLYGSGGIIVMLIAIGWFLNRDVVTPIVRLAERTEDFSLGENLDEPIDKNATGEVGVLAQSIERLRISLNKLMQRNR